MRYIFLSLFIASASSLELAGVDYSQLDKQGHFLIGSTVSAVAILELERHCRRSTWYERALVGIGAAALVGALKETADSLDQKHHTADTKDFIATTTGGACVALSLCWRF